MFVRLGLSNICATFFYLWIEFDFAFGYASVGSVLPCRLRNHSGLSYGLTFEVLLRLLGKEEKDFVLIKSASTKTAFSLKEDCFD